MAGHIACPCAIAKRRILWPFLALGRRAERLLWVALRNTVSEQKHAAARLTRTAAHQTQKG